MSIRVSSRRAVVSAVVALMVAVLTVPIGPSPVSAAPPDGPDALADFEGGLPDAWFNFAGGSSVNTSTVVVGDGDPLARPGQVGANEILTLTYNVFDFGGFGQDVAVANGGPQDWSTTAGMSFWFNGTGSGLTYQAEISDNRSDPATDTSERFDYEFTDDSAGWRLITIPWSDFTRATDFQPGGAPDDGLTLTEVWAWAIVLPLGTDTVYFDDVRLDNPIIDDFESGLPSGVDGDGVPVGFYTFQDAASTVALSTTNTPPAPVPGSVAGNNVMQLDLDVTAFAGFIHGFTNDAIDAWVPQDWSDSEGLAFWLYGNGSGTSMFIDILDNRNPGSTGDDAERWTVVLTDDFSGWQYFEIPFSSFTRKEIGNSAPNDGFTLTEVHGWAFGTLGTGGPLAFYLDDAALYGTGEAPPLAVQLAQANTFIEEGTTGNVGVRLNRALGPDDPAEVSIDYATERSNAVPGEDFTPTSGTLTFTNGGPRELSFPVETFDDTKFTGDLQVVIRLTNPVGAERGTIFQGSVLIDDNDPFDPKLLDDFEQGAFFWDTEGPAGIEAVRTAAGDPDARPGQDPVENIGVASVPISVDVRADGNLCRFESTSGDGSGKGKVKSNSVAPVTILTTDSFDATTIDGSTVTLGDASETHGKGHPEDVDGDGDDDLVLHFRQSEIGEDVICDGSSVPVNGFTFDGQAITSGGSDAALVHDFPIGQDWTETETLDFWFKGSGSGDEVVVTLKDNRAPDPGPAGWELVWADEFNDPAGTPPNQANWAYELGDTTPDGKNGWGNEELQYYTDDPANAATDGDGNLVITLTEADGSQECYYGPCQFESARLITQNKAEFAYGRIESRLQVPTGGNGLWPAFWSLGTDITYNPWPGAGEIDFMEYVSRLPNEIFGTIHGPGYNGGGSFGGIYDFGERVDRQYHTFTVEWQPDLITWSVDGIQYHQAEPSDVPGPWVFEKPFFLLLNFAVGGNFGGPVDPDNTYPQEYLVDYVRVFQGPDTAERFETSFIDSSSEWQQMSIPLTDFSRSADQPAGAPDDGLTLTDVWGYGFAFPEGNAAGEVAVDLVERALFPPPTEVTVTSAADGGAGSLKAAIDRVADGGTISIDPALAGQTLNLTSGPIVVGKTVTIDGTGAPGFSVSGGAADRVLIVNAGGNATVIGVDLTNGFGFQLAGCVLNNGTLTLDSLTVSGCTMTTDLGDFWQGGAGVYNGEGATFTLVDSTVSGNDSGHAGGGVFSFFGTTTTIERSTISGNTAADVGGGMRSLGNVDVINSTISGNTASANFHGGAVFVTDGVMNMVNTTVADNTSTGGTGDVFVGTFTGANATVNLTNTIIQSGPGSGAACFLGFFGAGAVALNSDGGNLATDGTCSLTGAGDLPNTDPLLGPLADNGGPTQTHALNAGSPAIDAANGAACPATDQRGVARVGACDIGAYERE
ncbi:MAG: family 16 glycosylhydrolase [Acidimicrobiia bacterium]|nr:family 16 glycosylhydrolase [Acidimicrobiia bacterium]